MNDSDWLTVCKAVATTSNFKNKFQLTVISARHTGVGFAGVHGVNCTVDFESVKGIQPIRLETQASFGGCNEWDGIFLTGFLVNCNGDICNLDPAIKAGVVGSIHPREIPNEKDY